MMRLLRKLKISDATVLGDKSRISPIMIYKKLPRDTKQRLGESSRTSSIYYFLFFCQLLFHRYLFLDPPGGISKQENSLHTLHGNNRREPNSRILFLSSFRPNSRNCTDRASGRTRQSPVPSSILKPLNILLRFAHPVRNNKYPDQLLNSHAPALCKRLQLQEYSTI